MANSPGGGSDIAYGRSGSKTLARVLTLYSQGLQWIARNPLQSADENADIREPDEVTCTVYAGHQQRRPLLLPSRLSTVA